MNFYSLLPVFLPQTKNNSINVATTATAVTPTEIPAIAPGASEDLFSVIGSTSSKESIWVPLVSLTPA